MSTSLMPTPGPPLRVREGMIRRGRAGPPAFEVEGVLEPGWEEVTSDNGDESVVGLAPAEVAFAFAGADIATATLAGSVVDADARRGIQRGYGGGCWVVAMASSLCLGSALPAPLWYSLCGSAVNDGEHFPPLQRYLIYVVKTIIM